MKKPFISTLVAFWGFILAPSQPACAQDPGKKYTITHFNITFAPDLSNRTNRVLYNRPMSDVEILKMITHHLYPTIIRFKRSENQQDKLLVDFINKSLISVYGVQTDKLLIDFGRFRTANERINYIKGWSDSKQTLKNDSAEMIREFFRIEAIAAEKENFGADIWTYFNEGIDDKNVRDAQKPTVIAGNTYTNSYRNILVLPTDGYIEAGIFGKGFDLSKHTIDQFRKAFLASGQPDIATFFKHNKKFRIRPVHNGHLKNLEVLVMELYDRSRSKGGGATVQPTDMEIIRLFWTDWLHESGVKRFELRPYANSKAEAEQSILHFLGIK